jgi:NADPH2:quinone reductase
MMKGMTAQYLFRQVYPLKGSETIQHRGRAAWAGGLPVGACDRRHDDRHRQHRREAAWRAHGCAHTIVTSREDIAKRVREITGGEASRWSRLGRQDRWRLRSTA